MVLEVVKKISIDMTINEEKSLNEVITMLSQIDDEYGEDYERAYEERYSEMNISEVVNFLHFIQGIAITGLVVKE